MEFAIIPHFMIRHFSNNSSRQYDYNVLLTSILILTSFVLLRSTLFSVLEYLPHFCLIHELFNINCPGCGMTRAFVEVSKGNIVNALNLNSASMILTTFIVIQIPARTVSLVFSSFNKKINSFSTMLGKITLICILFNWIINL